MPGFRDLSRLPARERALWVLVRRGEFPTRDVRRLACLPVHKDLRYNLLEYIVQPLRARCAVTARKALRLALHSVVGEKLDQLYDYQLDRDLDLSWLTEFFYRTSPAFECIITYPEVFGDGTVASVPTQAELEQQFGRPDFVSPSDPDRYCPQLSATIRSHLPSELQQEVLVHLGLQAICEVIVACFGRDKTWGEICVRALEESVKRWVLAFVREAIKDDWKQARTPDLVDQFCWEDVRENVPSPLWGFAGVPEDLFGHTFAWRNAGFFRVKDEEYNLQRSLEPPPSPPGSPGSRGAWSVCT
jgi:hypothetical protein